MIKSRYDKIDSELAIFTLGEFQDLLTLMLIMDREDISHEELLAFKELKISEIKNSKHGGEVCSECDSPMRVEAVNISPRTMTGDDSKIVYTCINLNCMNQRFE